MLAVPRLSRYIYRSTFDELKDLWSLRPSGSSVAEARGRIVGLYLDSAMSLMPLSTRTRTMRRAGLAGTSIISSGLKGSGLE